MIVKHPVLKSSPIGRIDDHLEHLILGVDEKRGMLDELGVAFSVRSDLDAQSHELLIGESLNGTQAEPMVLLDLSEAVFVLGPEAVVRGRKSVDAVEYACPAALLHLAVDSSWLTRVREVDVVDAVLFDAALFVDVVAVRRAEFVAWP